MIGLPTSHQTTTEVRQQCNMIFEVLKKTAPQNCVESSIQGKNKNIFT